MLDSNTRRGNGEASQSQSCSAPGGGQGSPQEPYIEKEETMPWSNEKDGKNGTQKTYLATLIPSTTKEGLRRVDPGNI